MRSQLTAALAIAGVIPLFSACSHRPGPPRLAEPTAAVSLPPEGVPPALDERSSHAIRLYDEGRYAEARPLLQTLDAEGIADGPLLYRLSFTLRVAGDGPAEKEVLDRAIGRLEDDLATDPTLETPFYLSNAYRNANRAAESRALAGRVTQAVDAGERAAPTEPLEIFRLGKLHQDQGHSTEAAAWYGRALEGFAQSSDRYPAYVRWARRYLGENAFQRADFAAAEREFAALAKTGLATPADYDTLAMAQGRQGRWKEAADAWHEAEELDRANADRARYCRRLAEMAAGLDSLPARAPDGSSWNQISKEDLEKLLQEQAQAVREARARSQELPGSDPLERERLAAAIARAKPIFVAAGLEYALRNLPIREAAFVGGFAPLIFQPAEWELISE